MFRVPALKLVNSVYFQPEPQLPREIVDDADLFYRWMRNVWDGHSKLTGQEHGGESVPHFAVHLFGNRAPRGVFFALATMQCRSHFAHQTLHPSDGKVEVDGESRAQMLDHLLAFIRLGFEQKLIDDGGGIALFAQTGGRRLQGLGPVRFLPGGGVQRLGALWTAG